MTLKKPSTKNIEAIQEVMEDSLKAKAITVKYDGVLASIIFPSSAKVPKDMPALREELEYRNFLMFTSEYMYKDVPILSINITKIVDNEV